MTVSGTSSLGDITETFGVQIDADLNLLAGADLTLNDVDLAKIGDTTTMASGSKLTTTNGFLVQSGQQVQATGSAEIAGPVTNEGTIVGPTGSDSLLLSGDVDGPGDFMNNIEIGGTYSPGSSPASVLFDGNLILSGGLVLEIGGSLIGIERDFISVTGDVEVQGAELTIQFLNGYTPTGDLDLISAAGTLTGSFSSIVVLGLSEGSNVTFNGGSVQFSLAAVPEPSTGIILLMGIAFLGRHKQRRKFS